MKKLYLLLFLFVSCNTYENVEINNIEQDSKNNNFVHIYVIQWKNFHRYAICSIENDSLQNNTYVEKFETLDSLNSQGFELRYETNCFIEVNIIGLNNKIIINGYSSIPIDLKYSYNYKLRYRIQ